MGVVTAECTAGHRRWRLRQRMEKYSALVATLSLYRRGEADLAEVLKAVRQMEKRAHARGWKVGALSVECDCDEENE